MKNLFLCLTVLSMAVLQTYGQTIAAADSPATEQLPVVYLYDDLSVHFLSPEPILYVDISSGSIAGDIPVKNMLRIKHRTDSLKDLSDGSSSAVVTIACEKFIAQYRVVISPTPAPDAVIARIEIIPEHTRPLDFPGIGLSHNELKSYALRLIAQKPHKNLPHSRSYGLSSRLNHVYTLGDYIFLDISFQNTTNLRYDIDVLRFNIADKKITRATTVQSVAVEPTFVLLETSSFKTYYRNVFVFKKFTFPGHKMLTVELSEKQLSGRTASLTIAYKDILEADILSPQ